MPNRRGSTINYVIGGRKPDGNDIRGARGGAFSDAPA